MCLLLQTHPAKLFCRAAFWVIQAPDYERRECLERSEWFLLPVTITVRSLALHLNDNHTLWPSQVVNKLFSLHPHIWCHRPPFSHMGVVSLCLHTSSPQISDLPLSRFLSSPTPHYICVVRNLIPLTARLAGEEPTARPGPSEITSK